MPEDLFIESLHKYRLMPAIVMNDSDDADDLGEAFTQGGLPILEITYRTSAAGEIIHRLRQKFPHLWVGAGTVTSINQLHDAIRAGAQFIVSPGLNPTIVKAAQDRELPIIPGVMTPSEIERADSLGLRLTKFFPAEAAGGIKALNAYSGPYPTMQFLPTGGITPDNIASYLKCKNVLACGGSWMAPAELLQNRQFSQITDLIRAAVDMVGQISTMRG